MSNLFSSLIFTSGEFKDYCVEFFQMQFQTDYFLVDDFVSMQKDKIYKYNGVEKQRKACKEEGFDVQSDVESTLAWGDVVRITTWGKEKNSKSI